VRSPRRIDLLQGDSTASKQTFIASTAHISLEAGTNGPFFVEMHLTGLIDRDYPVPRYAALRRNFLRLDRDSRRDSMAYRLDIDSASAKFRATRGFAYPVARFGPVAGARAIFADVPSDSPLFDGAVAWRR